MYTKQVSVFFEGYSFLMIIPDNFMRDPLVDNPTSPQKREEKQGYLWSKKK